MFPAALAYDLNQNPTQRAKKSWQVLSTLTTGCSHTWLSRQQRVLRGLECMALHSIPVTAQVSSSMRSRMVDTSSVSHSGCCFLAGNSMHGSSVGAFAALSLLCTKVKY